MASRHGEGRVVSLLEGGYNLDNLGRTVHDHIAVLGNWAWFSRPVIFSSRGTVRGKSQGLSSPPTTGN